MKSAIGTAICVLTLALAASGQNADDATGKTFERVCGFCHDTATATAQKHTRREWQDVVDEMVGRGASGTDAELRDVVGWLTRHYGIIRINQLNAKDLETEMELTHDEAEALVAYRSKHGHFENFDAVRKVPGVDPSKLEPYMNSIVY